MSNSKSAAAAAPLLGKNADTGVGRMEGWVENNALNSSTIDNKIFYMYREVIITLLTSFPQPAVAKFLFGEIVTQKKTKDQPTNENDVALNKMFDKNGEIDPGTFDRVVWFSYNARNYANTTYSDNFFNSYLGNFLSTIDTSAGEFNIELASESVSLILCR